MILPTLLCAVGLACGALLIRRVPVCAYSNAPAGLSLSIIIPARNEERNLPRLLHSIANAGTLPKEVIVVDDGSIDHTAAIAAQLGAYLVCSAPKPASWTGKSWACFQGAQHATGDLLLFLDADTHFLPGGLDRIASCWIRENDPQLVLSILPYHIMNESYEQLSLVFSILMAAGAGGFGLLAKSRLFGQSLLISRPMYFLAGGHASVPGVVLENLRWASKLRGCGARLKCFGGEGALQMRMFPDGLRKMSESWAKAFTQGAVDSGPFVLAVSVVWVSVLWSATSLLASSRGYEYCSALVAYLLLGFQISSIGRQLGNYRFFTSFLFPIPLVYFCFVFGRATARKALGRKTEWRGREV